jgi:hypothetical protein
MISVVNNLLYLSGNILLLKYRQTKQIGSSGNLCDLYSWGTWFISRPEQSLSWKKKLHNFIQSLQANFWIVSGLGHDCSFKILSNSPFICPIIRRYILLIKGKFVHVLNYLSTIPRRSGCIDPHFLEPGSSWRWVVSFTSRPLYPRIHYIESWLDPWVGVDDIEKWNILPLTGTPTPTSRSFSP